MADPPLHASPQPDGEARLAAGESDAMSEWDCTTDLLVVGSGAGAMTAALVARREGLDSLVVEKTPYFGGSSALSGGGLWVPNSPLMAEAGLSDSFEQARTYLDATVGERVPAARKDAYLRKAPEMVEYMLAHSRLELELSPKYTDYYPDLPGAMTGGRCLDPKIFSGRRLGPLLCELRPRPYDVPLGMVFTAAEVKHLFLFGRGMRSLLVGTKVFLRTAWSFASGAKLLNMGQALVAPLRLSLHELGVPVWLNTGAEQLILGDGRVVGVAARKEGQAIRILAKRGVVLAAGGFAHNQEMRERYQRAPIRTEWSSASPGNTGDAIRMGLEIGAALDLMEEAWWGPTSLPPGEQPFFHVVERSCPGSIIVDSAGRRFTNEAASYIDVVHAMYAHNREGVTSIPAYFVMDQRFRSHYPWGLTLPGRKPPATHFQSGYIKVADTLEELAQQARIDPGGLLETVARFNDFARDGKDPDFHRGENAYDRYYGDATVKPNPCLAPLEKPPFYAVALFPGDLGTKGGLVTDEHARVLREDGSPIEGLYATGNVSASVMGDTYPGPGSTLGPAMTFGYVAAMHARELGKFD
jgi:3-oxosteroid 1-dehydrogenase